MKRYQITLNGRTFDVRVLTDPRQEQVEVEVDGKALTVEVKSVPTAEEGGAATKPVGQGPGSVPVASPAATTAKAPGTPGENRVTAPLPGVIKSIVVRPGQQISAGDKLLVIEAMKMDNVLRASRGGVVEKVHAMEGHQVAHGELLLEYRAQAPVS